MNVTHPQQLATPTPMLAIASGKGGAGKTSFTVNLAASLAKAGKKVLVFDGDLGLGNVDVQLGLTPKQDLSHVLLGQATLAQVVCASRLGFDVVPGCSGSDSLPFAGTIQRRALLQQLQELATTYHMVLLDVAAGVGEEVLAVCAAASRTVVVTTPDPSSLTDAYALIKLLKIRKDYTACGVVVNNAATPNEGARTFEKLHTAAQSFLQLKVPLWGVIPHDREYASAIKLQKVASEAFPNSKAVAAIGHIAKTFCP